VTEPPPTDPEPGLSELVAAVLAQAAEIADLDGPRAEAWASDVLAFAAETLERADSAAALVAILSSSHDAAATIALWALGAFVSDVPTPDRVGPVPGWADSLGTSVCEGAWLLETRDGVSAAFRFVDTADVRHVVTVDLAPGPPERLGEVVIGPGDLLDALDEQDADVAMTAVPGAELAARVATALAATDRPRESAVVNGRLLVARLASITGEDLSPPVAVADDVPEIPARDPEDDAWALGVLDRALGRPDAPGGWGELADLVRARAADHDDLAAWLAASGAAPDDPDEVVALAPVVAAVVPADLAPLHPAGRDAVLALEWADWLGAVIGLVRTGEGAPVGGEALVDHINRCPEVTSTIPKQDRDRIAWAFDVVGGCWTGLGLTEDGVLTPRGVLVLPAALRRAWAPS
jgi:hypothetical protein